MIRRAAAGHWRRAAAVLAVVAVALLLRVAAVERLPIDFDEDDYLRAAQQYLAAVPQRDLEVFARENREHPPLAKLVFAAAIAPLPEASEVPRRATNTPPATWLPEPQLTVARLVAGALGTLQVLALALLDPLAALFLSVHTFQVRYTSQAYIEALPSLTALLAAICYLRSAGRARRWVLLSGAFLGLTLAAKYAHALVAVPILLHWAWTARRDPGSRPFRAVGAWAAVAVVVFFLADPYLWPDPLRRFAESVSFHTAYAQGESVRRAAHPPWQPFVWLSQPVPLPPGSLLVAVDTLVALLALVGVPRLWERQRFFALWLLVAFVFLVAWPTKWPQYVLLVTPPLGVAAAEGVRTLAASLALLRRPRTGYAT